MPFKSIFKLLLILFCLLIVFFFLFVLTEVQIKVQVFDNSDLSPLADAQVEVHGNQSKILASSRAGGDGVVRVSFLYRAGTWVIITASKQDYVTNSVPWHSSRIPCKSPRRKMQFIKHEEHEDRPLFFCLMTPSLRVISLPLSRIVSLISDALCTSDLFFWIHHVSLLKVTYELLPSYLMSTQYL